MVDEATTSISCTELIQNLTADDRAQLIRFAEYRLAFFYLSTCLAEDSLQQAIYAFLNGGRHPKPSDLADKEAFLNYLRGAQNSIIEGWARPYKKNPHDSLDEIQEVHGDLAAPTKATVEFNDFKSQLFARLRQRAPARLLPTIDAWEKAPDDRIPCVTCRKHVAAVKKLAQLVCRELGVTSQKKGLYNRQQVL